MIYKVNSTSFVARTERVRSQVMVGFDNFFESGTDPFRCDGVRAQVFDTQVSRPCRRGETSITPSVATSLGEGARACSSAMPDDNEGSIRGFVWDGRYRISGRVKGRTSHAHPNFGSSNGDPPGRSVRTIPEKNEVCT